MTVTIVEAFEWTKERIAAVKDIAAANGTARTAAVAVGLDPERVHLVYRLAEREGFKFSNVGRKRDDRAVFVKLDDLPSDILPDRARARGVARRDLAAKLLNIVLQQGPTFLDNLIDDGAA